MTWTLSREAEWKSDDSWFIKSLSASITGGDFADKKLKGFEIFKLIMKNSKGNYKNRYKNIWNFNCHKEFNIFR